MNKEILRKLIGSSHIEDARLGMALLIKTLNMADLKDKDYIRLDYPVAPFPGEMIIVTYKDICLNTGGENLVLSKKESHFCMNMRKSWGREAYILNVDE